MEMIREPVAVKIGDKVKEMTLFRKMSEITHHSSHYRDWSADRTTFHVPDIDVGDKRLHAEVGSMYKKIQTLDKPQMLVQPC